MYIALYTMLQQVGSKFDKYVIDLIINHYYMGNISKGIFNHREDQITSSVTVSPLQEIITLSHSLSFCTLSWARKPRRDDRTRTQSPALFNMVVTVEGVYKEESNENVDAYLSAIGLPWIARKAAGLMSPTLGEILEEL